MTQLSTPGYFQKWNENMYLHKGMYVNVHSSIIHNSQNVETTQISIDRWMNKQNVV